MNQDEVTRDAFDTELTRLFAEKNEPLRGHEFMQQVVSRLDREYRMQWVRRGLVALVIMLLAAVAAPWVVRGTMSAFSLVGRVQQLPGVNDVIMVGMLLVAAGLFIRARRWA